MSYLSDRKASLGLGVVHTTLPVRQTIFSLHAGKCGDQQHFLVTRTLPLTLVNSFAVCTCWLQEDLMNLPNAALSNVP